MREWVVRYGWAEVGGTITAFLVAYTLHQATGSLAAAAVAGTIGENVGYYGVIAAREVVQYWRLHHGRGRVRRSWLTAMHTVRGMLVEFGVAEVLDSLLVRPGLLYVVPLAMGQGYYAAALLIAKLLADLVFYGVAIIGYEVRKRYIDAAPRHVETDTIKPN